MKKILSFFLLLLTLQTVNAENGYRLWLRYDLIENSKTRSEYREALKALLIEDNSPTLSIAKKEMLAGLGGLGHREILRERETRAERVPRKPAL